MAATPLYKPPTRIATIQIPFLALVSRADPNWSRYKHNELQYQFQRREFYGDPYKLGAYSGKFDNP